MVRVSGMRFSAVLPSSAQAAGWASEVSNVCAVRYFSDSPPTATHFTFLREIPMFAHYEMRVGLLTFDSKWVRSAAVPCLP